MPHDVERVAEVRSWFAKACEVYETLLSRLPAAVRP